MFSPRSRPRTQTNFVFPVSSSLHQFPAVAARTPQPTHSHYSHHFTAVQNSAALKNFPACTGGRITSINAPLRFVHESCRNNNPTPRYGLMASTFRGRKNLVCFYCNKRSNTQYDGFMTRWDCLRCDSTNFLDENGEITDPPATEFAATSNLQYAIPRPDSPPSSQGSGNALFCSTCLKNQHLFTASLAQYDVVLDTSDRDYRKKEKEYYAFRRRLEKTYPQVCEDCEPKVLSRMKEAGMTAKADHLRRLMDKTRAKRSQRPKSFSASSALELGGKSLWYLGLLGQLLWSAMVLVGFLLHNYTESSETLSDQTYPWLDSLTTLSTSGTWIRSGLYCSLFSLWWNPMFKQMNKGFMNHINGFGEWYKIQVLMIISRSIFYYISGTGVLSDPNSPPTISAHIVMSIYILFLAKKAKGSLKVDMTPLWQSTPERLVNVGPKQSNAPPQASNDLADILDAIAASPGRGYKSITPSPSPRHPLHRPKDSPYDTPIRAPKALNNRASGFDRINNTPSQPSSLVLSNRPASPFNGGGNTHYLGTSTPQAQNRYSTGDEMDWTPATTQLISEHRAFQPQQPAGNATKFGHSPVDEHGSPFWYKLPPAPTTPAQRLRNPPNQPRFRAPTQEVKENFFNKVARRNSNEPTQLNGQNSMKSRNEMELRPTKFFPPTATTESENSLADLLTSFSLGSADPQPQPVPSKPLDLPHFGQALVLAIGLLFWAHSFSYPGEHTVKVLLAVMTSCIAIGTRTIIDNVKLTPHIKSDASRISGMTLGGLECIGAIYGIMEILAGRGECANCASLGMILLGGMFVQQFWYACIR